MVHSMRSSNHVIPGDQHHHQIQIIVLYLLAMLSGAAALIYELTWAKMLSLTFGSSTLSAAAVIAGFMGGMGLGARCYHLVGDRVTNPLKLYGLLELGIALTTAILTPLLYLLPEMFASLSHEVTQNFWLVILRFIGVFVILLIPSMLMGATFPALCAVMMRTAKDVDRHLGFIYGLNTIGGAVGVFVGGLFLIEMLGLSTTVYVANFLNLSVCIMVFILARSLFASNNNDSLQATDTAIPTTLPRWITASVLVVSGFTTLGYEILWFRALRFLVGNSTHALGIVLVIFLLGLGAGSLLLRRVLKRQTPERDLIQCQWAIAIFALWAMVCETLILSRPAIYEHVSIFLPYVRYQHWIWRLAMMAAISMVMMLPATLFMGLSFPLASRLFIGDVRKLGTRIGSAYMLASIGSIFGAVAAAIFVLTSLGVTGGTKLFAVMNLLLSLLIIMGVRQEFHKIRLKAVISFIILIGLFWILPSTLGLYGEAQAGRLAFEQEHDLGTVHVRESVSDPSKKLMLVDGSKIGCSSGYPTSLMYRKQAILVHLPMVLDSRIQSTLNIGLGSASTLKILSTYSSVNQLDCVEINPAVVRGSRLFQESSVLDDPRVNLSVTDAVHYLLRSDKKYDLIISDGKQDPFFSGNATLLCKEYYHYAKKRLTESGLYIQWISMSTLPGDFKIILKTLMSEFAYVETFVLLPNSALMVASQQSIFDRPHLSNQQCEGKRTFVDLTPYGINNTDALWSRWVAGNMQFDKLLDHVKISTWDHLMLDYTPFKAKGDDWLHAEKANLQFLIDASEVERDDLPVQLHPAENNFVQSSNLVRLAYLEYLSGHSYEATLFIEKAVAENPIDHKAKQFLRMIRQSK